VKAVQENQVFRTRVSQGFKVAVPAKLRERFGVRLGDVVIWTFEGDEVKARLVKRARLERIAALGRSVGKKGDAIELKKKAQRGEV
jgi:bifunctional DNA-binding transcriptional regulator/antitoxin component of YhaV-PrlF toxin-antitoxin module